MTVAASVGRTRRCIRSRKSSGRRQQHKQKGLQLGLLSSSRATTHTRTTLSQQDIHTLTATHAHPPPPRTHIHTCAHAQEPRERTLRVNVACMSRAGREPGFKKTNQDNCFAFEKYITEDQSLFGAMDGHGPHGAFFVRLCVFL